MRTENGEPTNTSNNILLVAFIPTVAKRLKIKNVEKTGF